jgi:hypothetical protein
MNNGAVLEFLLLWYNTMTESILMEGQCLFQLLVHPGTKARNSEAGTEIEAMEGVQLKWLASPWLAHSPFLQYPGPSVRKSIMGLPTRPVWCRHFLSWGSLFLNFSNLHQVDIKLASTAGWWSKENSNTQSSFRPGCLPSSPEKTGGTNKLRTVERKNESAVKVQL